MYTRLSVFLFILNFVNTEEEPLVELPQGLLKGINSETRNGRKISAFLGIPYGKAPIGQLRFGNPVPAEKWKGVYIANKDGNICPQLNGKQVIGVEHCLFLNVFTPILTFKSFQIGSEKKLLPVMVWIFGGGFYVGSANSTVYGPNYLLDRDVILVSMNYRLGVLGFFTTGDQVVPGNMGLKDQVLALKWVESNIHLFGGDPKRVTIFGQSSAGACVNLHALSDLSKGLFHQYIIESGSAFTGWAYRRREEFKPHINELANNVGCPAVNYTILLKCLQEKSVDSLVKTFKDDLYNFSKLIWIPTNELSSENAFMRDSPVSLIKQKKMKDCPSMTGTVADEGLSTTLNFYKKEPDFAAIKNALEQYMTSTIESFVKPANLPMMRKIINEYYFNESVLANKHEFLKKFTKFASDSRFLYPEFILVEKMAQVITNPLYVYSFGYRGNASLTSLQYGLNENIGVTHSEELMYLFPFVSLDNTKKVDQKMIDLMVDLWTSFATNGIPTSKSLPVPALWQPYSKGKSFLQIGDLSNNNNPAVSLKHNYFADNANFWKTNFPV